MAKVGVYLGAPVMLEIEAEMVRLGRSTSWLLRRAWIAARREIQALPTEVDKSGARSRCRGLTTGRDL